MSGKSDPARLQAICEQGLALHRVGRLAEAASFYEQALELAPNHVDALHLLGTIRAQTGEPERGASLLRRAVAANPAFAAAHSHLGMALWKLDRPEEALASYDAAIALRPDFAEAHNGRGVVLTALMHYQDALASHDMAITLRPDQADAHYNRGVALRHLKRPEESLASLEAAIALNPGHAGAHHNRGVALAELRRPDEALASYDRAISLQPDYAEAHSNRGILLLEQRLYEQALESFDAAIALEPDFVDARFNRSLVLLSMGRLEEGFAEYRWRLGLARFNDAMPASPSTPWEGRSLAGSSILVLCEQGFGDSLHFIRYVRLLAAMAARVVVVAQPALVSLFRSIPGVEVYASLDESGFDFHIPLMCLPRLFGTTLETVPAEVPYLFAEADKVDGWAERLSGCGADAKVGLVWAGDSRKHDPDAHATDQRRSLSLSQFAPLARVAGVQFISLQKGEPSEQALWPPDGLRVVDMTADLHDFADTAALIANLDLVITVDTSVAHLAGALGKPVWILSRFDGCWRWLDGREDSPWYPTARLFHQRAADDWDDVVERVAAALSEFADQPAFGRDRPEADAPSVRPEAR
jgi:tetratricopeptide (TPR) repeat protein